MDPKEEEKKKIEKRFHRNLGSCLLPVVPILLGSFILMKSGNYEGFEQKYKTPVVEQYLATGKALSSLRYYAKSLNRPTDLLPLEARNDISVGASNLEGAIARIGEDSIKISKDPKVKNYLEQRQVFDKNEGKKEISGILLMFGGLLAHVILLGRSRKRISEELAELGKKYSFSDR